MKICLFGGTFDPPHIGHLMVAEKILKYYAFDKILFVPTENPPHKEAKKISPIKDRLEMLRLLIKNKSKFAISMEEVNCNGKSFSINTIRLTKSKMGIHKENCFFLIGSDALKSFHKWELAEKILIESNVLVVMRPGYIRINAKPWVLDGINIAPISSIKVSSKSIRKNIKANREIENVVPKKVKNYIIKKNLYRE